MTDSAVAHLPLERTSTAQHVANAVRDRLLGGEFAPGSRLPEDEIAAALRVSRNSVREGLQILAAEGLIRRSLHRGAVVSELSAEELHDVYQARRVIELAGLRMGVEQAGQWLDRIVAALREMEVAASADNRTALLDSDRRFHEAIVAGSESQRVGRFYRNLQTEIRLTRTWHGERESSPVFFARHKNVVDALRKGNLSKAESLLASIIDAGEDRVRRSLQSTPLGNLDGFQRKVT